MRAAGRVRSGEGWQCAWGYGHDVCGVWSLVVWLVQVLVPETDTTVCVVQGFRLLDGFSQSRAVNADHCALHMSGSLAPNIKHVTCAVLPACEDPDVKGQIDR